MLVNFILKKIVSIFTVWFLTGCFVYADIILDQDMSLDGLATRTQLVGTLSVTPSAGRHENISSHSSASVAWSFDSKYIAVTFKEEKRLRVYENETLRLLDNISLDFESTNGGATLSWNPISTGGLYYLAISGVSSSFIHTLVYKFQDNSLQELPLTAVENPLPVLSGTAPSGFPAWSYNGQYLAVCWETSIEIYNFDGTRLYSITNTAFDLLTDPYLDRPSWSYDGRYVGFSDGDAVRGYGDLRIYSFDGTQLSSFAFLPGDSSIFWIRLGFHPTKKFFAAGFQLTDSTSFFKIYSYTDSGVITLLQTVDIPNNEYPDVVAWSPDGKYFVVGNHKFSFYSFDDGVLTYLPDQTINLGSGSFEHDLSWSPDGRYLAIGLANDSSSPLIFNGISNSLIQLWNTGLNPTPSLAEAQVQAPLTLTNIVTSTADQFWGIDGGDLTFSSTESVITRMRGQWVPAGSQGSLSNSSFTYLLSNSLDRNLYALDLMGKAHVSTSVIVGPQVRINWQVLPYTFGLSPLLETLLQGSKSLIGISTDKIIYVYRPSTGWLSVGPSPL